jgi:hypothetical protein
MRKARLHSLSPCTGSGCNDGTNGVRSVISIAFPPPPSATSARQRGALSELKFLFGRGVQDSLMDEVCVETFAYGVAIFDDLDRSLGEQVAQ